VYTAAVGIVFGVTYRLKLRDAMTTCCMCHSLPTKGRVGCLDIMKRQHLSLVTNCIDDNNKKKKNVSIV
jgi:hypothetical protein